VVYLHLVGHMVYAYFWARMAKVAVEKLAAGTSEPDFYNAKLLTARFYFAKLLPETGCYLKEIRAGAEPLMAMDAALF
jgi:hypothetical protein